METRNDQIQRRFDEYIYGKIGEQIRRIAGLFSSMKIRPVPQRYLPVHFKTMTERQYTVSCFGKGLVQETKYLQTVQKFAWP